MFRVMMLHKGEDMNKIAVVASAVFIVLMGVGMTRAQEAQPIGNVAEGQTIKKQTVCPVMGGQVNTNIYVDADGKRVYVCCKGCIVEVKKNPAKYIKKLENDGITVAKLQTTCPVMGGKVDKSLYVDHAGKRVYVCCQECIATVQKDPAKYIKALEEAGVALDPAGKVGEAGEPKNESDGHAGHDH